MKTNEEKLAIYKAYLEGKKIQIKYAGEGHEWGAINSRPSFNYSMYDYRVKPVPVKPVVAKAYIMSEGYVIWTITDPIYPHTDSTRAPEFDIVAKEVP
jgi:hypothetical protein